jgi:hypothetical protein
MKKAKSLYRGHRFPTNLTEPEIEVGCVTLQGTLSIPAIATSTHQ